MFLKLPDNRPDCRKTGRLKSPGESVHLKGADCTKFRIAIARIGNPDTIRGLIPPCGIALPDPPPAAESGQRPCRCLRRKTCISAGTVAVTGRGRIIPFPRQQSGGAPFPPPQLCPALSSRSGVKRDNWRRNTVGFWRNTVKFRKKGGYLGQIRGRMSGALK
jgi:hypothetical protein